MERSAADRILKEQESHKSHRFLSDLMENSGAIICIKDRAGRYEQVNRKWEEVTGLQRQDTIGKTDEEFFPGPIAEQFRRNDLEVMESGSVLEKEEILEDKQGKRFFISTKFPLRNDAGVVRGVCGMITEITARKQAEQALKESDKKYQTLFENASEAIFIAQDGNLVFMNPKTEMMTGYSSEELMSRPFIEFIAQDDREMVVERHIKRMKGEDVPQRYAFRFVQRDGSIKWGELSAVMISWNGKPATLNFLSDITARRQAEDALRENEQKFRTIFESFEDIYYQTDLNGNIMLVSPSLYRISGWKPEELIGRPATVVYDSPEDRAALLKVLSEQGYVRDYELTLLRRDGSKAIASLAARLTCDSSGAPTGLTGTLRDISERKKTEERLCKSEKKFAAMFHLNPNPMAITDVATGKIIMANQEFSHWSGYALEEIIGASTLDLHFWINPDDRKGIIDTLAVSGQVNDAEVTMMIKNGSLRNVLFSARFVEIEQERHIMTLIQDITERLKMEVDLKASEKRYREFADFLPLPVCEFDVRGNLTFVNRSCFKFFGYTKDDYDKGLNALNMIVPRQHQMALEKVQRILKGEKLEGSDYTMIRKDGSTFPAIVFTNPVILEGKSLGLRAIIIDITDRQQAEQTLRENEATLRSVFKATPVGLCIMKNRVFQSANNAWYESFGYSEPDIIGNTTRMLYSNEEEYERIGQELYANLLDCGLASVQTRIRRKDGTFRDVILTAALLQAENPSLGTVVAIEDITERKQAVEELHESHKRLENIIEFLPDATLVIDHEGKVIAWNKAIETMTGVKKEDMLGKGNYEYALPFYGERRPILIDFALHPNAEMEKQYTTVQRIGNILFGESFTPKLPPGDIHLSGTASVLHDSKGQVIAAIECIRDTTERKKLADRLNRAEKMEAVGTLAGGVAHDLNNVLGVLVGFSELLAEKLPPDSSLKRYADNILQSSIRGAAIIQDLLTLARRGVNVSEVVNLNEIIFNYLQTPELEKLKFYHPDVKIRTELEDELLNIKGSPLHLGKTVMNLVSNAAESISAQGDITIRTENRYLDHPIRGYDEMKEGDYVILTVTDTGTGISAKDLGKIFEPFYTKKVMGRSGTGLGLAIVWGTVKDHQGYIDVKSEEGKGTIFHLYFPVTREEMVKADKAIPTDSYMSRGESILIVDDVKGQRDLAISMLGRLGYQVEAVASGEEALEYIKNKKADLIILDMIMDPGINGLETYKKIIEINPGQKAIVVSGFSETELVRKVQLLGAGDFIRKPYVMEKIGLGIRKELDRK